MRAFMNTIKLSNAWTCAYVVDLKMSRGFKMIPEFASQKAAWLQWSTSKYNREEDDHDFIPAFVEIERGCCTEREVHAHTL